MALKSSAAPTAKDARDNTATTFTSSDKGVPIYWLNGNKVADEYEDFYDGSWDDEANDKNESGTNGPDTSDRSQSDQLPLHRLQQRRHRGPLSSSCQEPRYGLSCSPERSLGSSNGVHCVANYVLTPLTATTAP